MKITDICADFTEPLGFDLYRKDIGNVHCFIYFQSKVEIASHYGRSKLKPGACILTAKHATVHICAPRNPLRFGYVYLKGQLPTIASAQALEFGRVYYPADAKKIRHILAEMEAAYAQSKPTLDAYTDIKVTELLLEMTNPKIKGTAELSEKQVHGLMRAREAMLKAYASEPDSQALAEIAKLDVQRFNTLYKQYFHKTPLQDLNTQRIRHAKHLLLQKKYSVSEVSALCGFKNATQFRNQFKKATGITPAKFHCI